MTEPAVRIGLVGYGLGGRSFHAPLIASAAECELVGVVTRSTDRRKELADDHPGVPAYESLGDLVAAGVDAVTVTTPAGTHTALTDEALRLGVPVVCDKPFAVDAAAARVTVELAERLGLPLSAYHNRRWDSDFLTVRKLVDAGRLGALQRVESRFERFRPEPDPDTWQVGSTPEVGGGVRLDQLSHLVDQALVLCGPVTQVYAEIDVRRPGVVADDDDFVALTHSSGVRTHLSANALQGAPGPRFRVTGSAGTYLVGPDGGLDGQEAPLRGGLSPATEGDRWGVEPPERYGLVHRGDALETVPTERGAWDTYYPAWAAAVRGNGPVPVDPWDAVAGLVVLDAAVVSAVEGTVVHLPGGTARPTVGK